MSHHRTWSVGNLESLGLCKCPLDLQLSKSMSTADAFLDLVHGRQNEGNASNGSCGIQEQAQPRSMIEEHLGFRSVAFLTFLVRPCGMSAKTTCMMWEWILGQTGCRHCFGLSSQGRRRLHRLCSFRVAWCDPAST